MEKYFDNKRLVDLLWKWKIHIIVITIVSGIIGGVISFLIKPKYESVAIVYPSNVSPYSEESETEQVLQIFQSADIRNTVIEKQNLYPHYKISEADPFAKTYMDDTWNGNVSISRTPNDAIKIRVLDADPLKAREIAQSIIDEYNLFTRQLHKSKHEEVVELFDRQRHRKFQMLDSLKQELRKYNEMGIYDIPYQAKELAAAMLKGGNQSKISELQDVFNEHSADYMIVKGWLEGEILALQRFLETYDISYTQWDREFTHVSIVSHPEIADRKYSPVRWLYVLSFMIGGLLIALVTIAFIDAAGKHK